MEEHENMDDIKLIKHTDDFRLNVMDNLNRVYIKNNFYI